MGSNARMNFYSQIVIPLLAEFTTQFIHTFWGVMSTGPYVPKPLNVSDAELDIDKDEASEYLQKVFVPAFQSGLSAWMQIVVFCKISCVHFNPAVSTGLLVSSHLRLTMYIPYVVTQCLSSVAAAYFAKVVLGADPSIIAVPPEANGVSIFFNEAIMTGSLNFFAVAMVMDDSYDQQTGPLAIGLTVFQGVLSARWVGTACLSPSRAFGPAVVTGGPAWNRHWLFWLADLTGAVVTSGYYMIFFAPKSKRWIFKLKKKASSTQRIAESIGENTKDSLINETIIQ